MIKRLILMLILACPLGIIGMEAPYEPGFAAKHPLIMRAIKTSGSGLMMGAATYAGSQLLKTTEALRLKNTVLAGAAAATAVYFYDKYKKPNLLDSVICDPQAVVEYRNRLEVEVDSKFKKIEEIQSLAERINAYKALVKKYEKDVPFVLIGECSGDCVLSRWKNSQFRDAFEKVTGNALFEKSKKNNDPIVYTSFGSGGKFQDLVILTRFLAKKPDAKLIIHLIDIRSKVYADCYDLSSRNSQITEKEIDIESLMPRLLEKYQKEFQENIEKYLQEHPESLDTIQRWQENNGINQKLICWQAIMEDLSHKEFLSWLTANFPRATISLHAHSSAQGYLEAIDKYKLSLPDVLAAADIEDDTGSFNDSIGNYLKLCSIMNDQKPSCVNVLLALNRDKDYWNPTGILWSIHNAKKAENDEEINFKKNQDEKEKLLYIHKTQI